MERVFLGNGAVTVKIEYPAHKRELYQRFYAFVSPYFLPQLSTQEVDLTLNLHCANDFSAHWKELCVTEHQIRKSSADEFNILLKRGELTDGTHIAWHERDQTGYAFVQDSKEMNMYVSDSSFIQLIEFIRYYMLLVAAGKGALLLHASAVQQTQSGDVVAICGVKGAGKTTTMLALSESPLFQYFSGDKLLVSENNGQLEIRGWPDYPHVGVGTLRQHPSLCRHIGLMPSQAPISTAHDRDKLLFTPELFSSVLGKPKQPQAKLAGIVLPDVLADENALDDLSLAQKQDIDQNKLFEDPYAFSTATWHGLHVPQLSEEVLEQHQRVHTLLHEHKWLNVKGRTQVAQINRAFSNQHKQLRIALVAPSGSGKSTVAALLKDYFTQSGMTVSVEKLAQPLYQLQAKYFDVLDQATSEQQQHQKLMECIADNLRMLSPSALVEHLFSRLTQSTTDVVITDDLRDAETDWPALIKQGYVCLKINCDDDIRNTRLQGRGDLQTQFETKLNASINAIEAEHAIENNHDLQQLQNNVHQWASSIMETVHDA